MGVSFIKIKLMSRTIVNIINLHGFRYYRDAMTVFEFFLKVIKGREDVTLKNVRR